MRSRERQGDKPGAVEEPIGATKLNIGSVDRAFESGERLAKPVAHHPKEGVHSLTDGAPINLSNALW